MNAPTGPARRAAAFQRMRDAHSTEMAEDYVELIGDLIAELGEARLTDLAENLGVSHATAAKVVARLRREGLVDGRPYRALFLTETGKAMAAASRERHRIVHDFLIALGLDELTAEADAEGMEHHVSARTLELFQALTERLTAGQGLRA
ncbi:manganese-binding transcriptional regulator MntR [Brevundimonas sp. VNH65]|uniref:manganese-binding transcriptional regulator MntR n=1 Tax=Brevundimonas sp. VNH65 TaxID=3400917 RepID=UPI003C061318